MGKYQMLRSEAAVFSRYLVPCGMSTDYVSPVRPPSQMLRQKRRSLYMARGSRTSQIEAVTPLPSSAKWADHLLLPLVVLSTSTCVASRYVVSLSGL